MSAQELRDLLDAVESTLTEGERLVAALEAHQLLTRADLVSESSRTAPIMRNADRLQERMSAAVAMAPGVQSAALSARFKLINQRAVALGRRMNARGELHVRLARSFGLSS